MVAARHLLPTTLGGVALGILAVDVTAVPVVPAVVIGALVTLIGASGGGRLGGLVFIGVGLWAVGIGDGAAARRWRPSMAHRWRHSPTAATT